MLIVCAHSIVSIVVFSYVLDFVRMTRTPPEALFDPGCQFKVYRMVHRHLVSVHEAVLELSKSIGCSVR